MNIITTEIEIIYILSVWKEVFYSFITYNENIDINLRTT